MEYVSGNFDGTIPHLDSSAYYRSVFLENHDSGRSVSRFGNDSPQWRTLSAKLLAILLVTLGGTLFLYQGEELGMKNIPKSWDFAEYKDIAGINLWKR